MSSIPHLGLIAFFEPELASLVGLQVVSSKEEREEEGELFDKILLALTRSASLLFGS